MRATAATSTPTTRARGRRALALAVALTIPLLSACGPDTDQGFPSLGGELGELTVLTPGGDPSSSTPAPALDGPGGVAVNQGVRYVADTGHQRVLRITREATCVLAGGAAAPVAPFDWCEGAQAQPLLQHPTALAVDFAGDVFIADPVAARVFVVDAYDRTTVPVVGTGQRGLPEHGAAALETRLHTPTALAVTSHGEQLYIADSGARQVLAVDVSEVTEPSFDRAREEAEERYGAAELETSEPAAAVLQEPSEPASTSADGSSGSNPADLDDAGEEGEQHLQSSLVTTENDETSAGDDTSSDETLFARASAGEEEQQLDGERAGDDERLDERLDAGGDRTSEGLEPVPAPSPSDPAPTTLPGHLYVVAGPGCAGGADGRPRLGAEVPARAAGVVAPSALAVLSDGEGRPFLYVGDRANGQVYVISDGLAGDPRTLTTIGSDDPALTQPVGLAVVVAGSSRQLVAVDAASHSVVRAPLGGASLSWSLVNDQLEAPSDVAPDRAAVLVTDSSADALLGFPVDASNDDGPVELLPQPVAFTGPVLAAASSGVAGADTGCAPVRPASGTDDRDLTPQAVPSTPRPKVPSHVDVPDAGSHRLSGKDRVATSVDTSKELFPKDGTLPVVVISSASSYADAAGGARYAAEVGGSLLLTPGGALDPAVKAEVQRTLASGGRILVTGREAAITPAVFSALEAIAPGRTERVGGEDRYETATKLAQKLASTTGVTSTGPIYLVTGANYPDALVVVPLARRTGGLVVLSKASELPPVTKALLQAMDPTGTRTVPVGGAAAKAVTGLGGDAARTAAAAAVVGSDRYETARKVAERFVALDGAAGARTDVVGLATGTDWPDALVGSTAMGSMVGPLLLNHGGQLDPNVVKVLAAIPSSTRPTTTVVFGGEKAVPASALTAFATAAKG